MLKKRIKEGLSFLCNYRVCTIILKQYLSQIISTYGVHDSRGIKMSYALSDNEDAKLFSELLGKTTVKLPSSSRTNSEHHATTSPFMHYQKRALLTPDELMRLKRDDAIIVVEGGKPIRAKKVIGLIKSRKKLNCKQN